LYCPLDDLRFAKVDGTWRFLLPERLEIFSAFIKDYEHIRAAEGRKSTDPAYFRALPFEDLSNSRPRDWEMRATSYWELVDKVLENRPSLKILDLGAGNGWLSHQLAELGHSPTAIDLVTNEWDGLGAFKHYPFNIPPLQAEFDYLPLQEAQFDLVIFNASFHYSVDYMITLREALRCLRRGGQVVILDTPIYSRPESGRQMLAERASFFKNEYGTTSTALPSEGFLTNDRIADLAASLNLSVQMFRPDYGLRRKARRLWVTLRGGREPARFALIVLQPVSRL
jgi:ubiquinone/menaquinone biosynthesis C-methylase UbiE